MKKLNKYRNMHHKNLKKQPVITFYQDVITGIRKTLPKGTWQKGENIIIIMRYVLEIKLQLSKQEIPQINRHFIHQHKLWGALNQLKSCRKLIMFVYPNRYNIFDFPRVSVGYWKNINNIKERFEYLLEKNKLSVTDIPSVVTYNLLVEWGFSNPLKHHEHSPFKLINSLYPGKFNVYEFKKIPQGDAENREVIVKQFEVMLKKENILLKDVPQKVTQEMLNKYRLNGALKHFRNSPSKLIQSLYPDQFSKHEFRRENGYWKDVNNVKREIFDLIETKNIPYAKIPEIITKEFLIKNKLRGLLHEYNGSPIEIIKKCFPNEFDVTEFIRVPNRYWYLKNNRIEALRNYCKKKDMKREDIAHLNRAYFQKHFPRFVSVVDRHYESKFYLWIIESFPEHKFNASDFKLHIGRDGQLCDSEEELLIHNLLVENLIYADIKREGIRFINSDKNETYIPDWIIKQNDQKYIVEYFGLYGSDRFLGYTEKVHRKILYYKELTDYKVVLIFPEDYRKLKYQGIIEKLVESGLLL